MEYDVTIGLEVHCELKSTSKVFSPSPNAYSENPNTNISVIDLAFPGILPIVNKEAIRKALTVATALNCETPEYMIFDRKNYYYPDLPKGYQITQLHHPVGINGYLDVYVEDKVKRIYIHDTHLEEDTASLDHYDKYSLIDYNRCGVPLLETVTEPCMHSIDEAMAFLESLKRLFLYTDVSDAKTELGQIRCDVNVSLAPKNSKELGVKVEMKNINSFYNVKMALESEIKRQTELLNNGMEIEMETRRYDESTMQTYRMRSKEEAIDYKYFIEPNIPPIKLTDELKKEVKDSLPELAFSKITRYINEYGLSLVDAKTIAKDKDIATYYENIVNKGKDPKMVSNWVTTRVLGCLSKDEITISDFNFTEDKMVELLDFIESGKISTKQAKDIFYKCIEENETPKKVVKESGMEQITNEEEIREIVLEVLEENSDVAKDYNPEKGRMLDFFIGQTMKKSRGKANPGVATKVLKEELLKYVNR